MRAYVLYLGLSEGVGNSNADLWIQHRYCRSPPLCEGARGPMASYFGTLTGFHSAPSQTIFFPPFFHAHVPTLMGRSAPTRGPIFLMLKQVWQN